MRHGEVRLNGAPVAMQCTLTAGSSSFGYRVAFDEEYRARSPGVQLVLEDMRRVLALPVLGRADSCASSNRFLFNQLYGERLCMQSLVVAGEAGFAKLALALQPLASLLFRLAIH